MVTSMFLLSLVITQVLNVLGSPITDRTQPSTEKSISLPDGNQRGSPMPRKVSDSLTAATDISFCFFHFLDKSETGSLPLDEWVTKQFSYLNAETIAPEDKQTVAVVGYLEVWRKKFTDEWNATGKPRCTFDKRGKEEMESSIQRTMNLVDGEPLETFRKKSVILKPKKFFFNSLISALDQSIIYPLFSFYITDKREVGALAFNKWLENQMTDIKKETRSIPLDKQTLAEVDFLEVWQKKFSEYYEENEQIRNCTKKKSVAPFGCLMDQMKESSTNGRSFLPPPMMEALAWMSLLIVGDLD